MIDISQMPRAQRNKNLARLAAYARQLYYSVHLPDQFAEKFAFKRVGWEANCRALAVKLGRDFEVDRVNPEQVVRVAEGLGLVVVHVRDGVPTPPWHRCGGDWRAAQQAKRAARRDGGYLVM